MSKHILIVDDSKTVRNLVAFIMRKEGFKVTAAEDGLDGLEKLYTDPQVDLIITDINMPRMDGFGVIEGVRANPNHRTTPVLVLTTESDVEKKARARAAGATGWIVKPFDPVKLVDTVRRVAA